MIRFGPFELQPREHRLLMDGQPVALGNRAFDLLVALAERPGQLLTRIELLERVWAGLVVEEGNLNVQINALRKVLGNGAIATIPGRGYRFSAPVERDVATPDRGAASPGTASSAPGPASFKTNLPTSLVRLLGRDAELAALRQLIESQRLVCIVGAGGAGKTLVAQHLLASVQPAPAHGVCWVDLAPFSDPALVPATIAAALAVPVGAGDAVAALCASVAPLDLLMVLDNAEHLLATVSRVADALHHAAPDLRLIVTSQAPLRLRDECVFRLDRLSVPEGDVPAAEALTHGAVALFTERVQQADRRFVLTDTNAGAVAALCRRLDGSALAIELAAARVPLLGLQGLSDSLGARLAVLTRGPQDAPPRQQTLRATLDWSHGLLAQPEQRLFRRLAVFVGEAALADVEQVVCDEQLEAFAMLDALNALIERSLVVRDPDSELGPRYRLLETPHAYALEKLVDAGELEPMRERHARAVSRHCEVWLNPAADLANPALAPARAPGPDAANALEAWHWARERGDVLVALRIGALLLSVLPLSMHAQKSAIADACEAMVDDSQPAALRSWVWSRKFNHWLPTHPQRCGDAARKSLAAAREVATEPGGRYRLYLRLGHVVFSLAREGDSQGADAALAEMESLKEATWPARALAPALQAARHVAKHQGRHQEALGMARRLVEMDGGSGFDREIMLSIVADSELASGDAAAAVRRGRELLRLLGATRREQELAYVRLNLCAAHLALGQADEAQTLAAAGWPQASRFDMQAWWADYMALLAAMQGRMELAARLLGYAQVTYDRHADRREHNEAVAAMRAEALARAAFDDATFARLRDEGATLGDAEVGAMVFGSAGG